jgi:uncharacterized repeat protein (TIGR01451 family)
MKIYIRRLLILLLLSCPAMIMAQVPVVKFGATKVKLEIYDFVELLDSSTNSPYQWEWNLYDSTTYKTSNYYPSISGGDVISDPNGTGKSEFTKNPEFTFDVPGDFTVTLRCRNSTGWSTLLVRKGYIKVRLPTVYNLGYGTYGPNNDNVVQSEDGSIFDDGGPNQSYKNNQGISTRSHLLIKPCGAKKIILSMTQLKFAGPNDVLYVYDADKVDNSNLLAAWTSTNTSGRIVTALSGNMFILFQSDGAGIDSGFAGTYTTELDTSTSSPILDIKSDSVLYNSVPFEIGYTAQGVPGVPSLTWTIDGNQAPKNSGKSLRYTFYTDGNYKICLKINHCKGTNTICDTVKVKTATDPGKMNFKASGSMTTPFQGVTLRPLTNKANRFIWTISPKSYQLLNPPVTPSYYDSTGIYYNVTPGDSLPVPNIKFLDTVCYTIRMIAYNSMDPAATRDTVIKANYVCGKDFKDVFGLFGRVFHDRNTDCQMTGAEPGLEGIKIKLYDSINQFVGLTYTMTGGLFGFEKTSGTYSIVMDLNGFPLKVTCPTGKDSTVTFGKSKPFNGVNFALDCDAKVNIGVSSVNTSGIVFPGRLHTLSVKAGALNNWFGMKCLPTSSSGSVKITIQGNVTYKGVPVGARTPTSISGKVFTYAIADFNNVNIDQDFQLKMGTDTFAKANDTIKVAIEVLPVSGDSDTTNNRVKMFYLVRNSYDPNLKEVTPVNVPPLYSDWLTYTVHFQNTGTAPAFNIRLGDTLDNRLDIETFNVTDYSHVNRILLKNRVLTVYFDDIMLPDSFSDSKGSMGHIQYRIKPVTNLAVGTRLSNTAYIYFDYNTPVVTNTTINEYVEVVNNNINPLFRTGFRVYPNPGTGIYNIHNPGGDPIIIEVYNTMGVLVVKKFIEPGVDTFDISNEPDIVYFLKVYVDGMVQTLKLLKN